MWADRVTVRQCMGCSPYYAVTGTHPLLPLDIAEATYLLPPPDALTSTTALIANRVTKAKSTPCEPRDRRLRCA